MQIFRDTNGSVYAFRLWRLVVYVGRASHPALRHGGIVTNFDQTRPVAQHIGWRLSLVR